MVLFNLVIHAVSVGFIPPYYLLNPGRPRRLVPSTFGSSLTRRTFYPRACCTWCSPASSPPSISPNVRTPKRPPLSRAALQPNFSFFFRMIAPLDSPPFLLSLLPALSHCLHLQCFCKPEEPFFLLDDSLLIFWPHRRRFAFLGSTQSPVSFFFPEREIAEALRSLPGTTAGPPLISILT